MMILPTIFFLAFMAQAAFALISVQTSGKAPMIDIMLFVVTLVHIGISEVWNSKTKKPTRPYGYKDLSSFSRLINYVVMITLALALRCSGEESTKVVLAVVLIISSLVSMLLASGFLTIMVPHFEEEVIEKPRESWK